MNKYQYGYEDISGDKHWFIDWVNEETARRVSPISSTLIRRKLSEAEVVGPKLPKLAGSVVTYRGSWSNRLYTAVKVADNEWRAYKLGVSGALLNDADLVDLGFTIIHEAE